MSIIQQIFGSVGPRSQDATRGEQVRCLSRILRVSLPKIIRETTEHNPNRSRKNRYQVFETTLRYKFDRALPWFPEQLRDALSREVHDMLMDGTIITNRISYYAIIDDPQEYNHMECVLNSNGSNFNFTNAVVGSTMTSFESIDWTKLLDFLYKIDKYDSLNEIERTPGNRMSRLKLVISEYRIPEGNGYEETLGFTRNTLLDFEADQLCGQSCLAYIVATPSIKKHMCKRARKNYLLKLAREMGEKIGYLSSMPLDGFDKFTEIYKNYRIIVMDIECNIIYSTNRGDVGEFLENVYILLNNSHYMLVRRIQKFASVIKRISKGKWCHYCLNIFDRRSFRQHACLNSCKGCGHVFCSDPNERESHYVQTDLSCERCNFNYYYVGCQENHRCRKWKCMVCSGIYEFSRINNHICGEKYCKKCKVYYNENHRCFISKPSIVSRNTDIYAYDIECTLDEENGVIRHNISIIVAMKLGNNDDPLVFRDVNTFIEWIISFNKKTILIAHNAASYDSYLLLKAFKNSNHQLIKPSKLITAGRKIILMKAGKCVFLDSFKHLHNSLNNAAKSFGINEVKSYFPYRFYTIENKNYIGPVPPKEMFPENVRNNSDFIEWWEGKDEYNIEEECVRYCIQDVEMLRRILEEYQNVSLELTGVNPLEKATVASYVQYVYRARFMPENSIPILNRDEYEFCRLALQGGRTDARQIYREFTNEQIENGNYAVYVDINSQYPTVMKFDPLPTGIPRWMNTEIVGHDNCAKFLNELENNGELAIIKCSLTSPNNLIHPVLVQKRENDGRLQARLGDLEGSWTSVELLHAVSKGYIIHRIIRALISQSTVNLFSEYIDTFHELKERAKNNGNKSMKKLAKMLLNTLWGKFAQRDREEHTQFFIDPQKWFREVQRFHANIIDMNIIERDYDNNWILANISKNDTEILHLNNTNVMLASFVTSNARLRLLREMELLDSRVIYHDTDSIIYEKIEGEYDISLGNNLGEWEDEEGQPINMVCCLGPKTYAYRTIDGNEHVKSKGFTEGSYSFDDYKTIVDAFFEGNKIRLEREELQFSRDEEGIITLQNFTKKLMFSLNKMRIISRERTVPFGYQL